MLRKLARQIDFYLSQLSQNFGPNSFHLVQLRKKILHRCCLLHIPGVDSQFPNVRDNAIAEADNLSNQADASAILRWRNKIKVDFQACKRETFVSGKHINGLLGNTVALRPSSKKIALSLPTLSKLTHLSAPSGSQS